MSWLPFRTVSAPGGPSKSTWTRDRTPTRWPSARGWTACRRGSTAGPGRSTRPAGRTINGESPDPTIEQILTRFAATGYWEGSYRWLLRRVTVGLRFTDQGQWTLCVDGARKDGGTLARSSRLPDSFSVVFSLTGATAGTHVARLDEIAGAFEVSLGIHTAFKSVRFDYAGA